MRPRIIHGRYGRLRMTPAIAKASSDPRAFVDVEIVIRQELRRMSLDCPTERLWIDLGGEA